MGSESGGNDSKAIWQGQPTEPLPMTLEKLRQKTAELRAKTRRTLIKGMFVPLAVAVMSVQGIGWFNNPALRAVFAIAMVWSVVGQYRLYRETRPSKGADASGMSTGLASYRREVERQSRLYGGFLLWSLGPVLLAIFAFVMPLLRLGMEKGVLRQMIPFLALLGIWTVSLFVIRLRDRRELKREIRELDAIEKENRG